MKLKRKILITSFTMVILPLLLTTIAYIGIGTYLLRSSDESYDARNNNIHLLTDSTHYVEQTVEWYNTIRQALSDTPSLLEDPLFLETLRQEMAESATCIMIRRNEELYYCSSDTPDESLLQNLPNYGQEAQMSESGVYFLNRRVLLKQLDFVFSNGDLGSLFVITYYNDLFSMTMFAYMFMAIILILIISSITLTSYINRGVVRPIHRLSRAMSEIAEGNLEYRLDGPNSEDFSALYRNYELMRNKLKESAEEKLWTQKQNSELISNITHDLKTPITSIKGYVEGIMDGVADTPEKMDKYIRTIYNKTNDMNRLINELTTYSAIDSNRIPYSFQKINIGEYFDDCAEEIGLDLESKKITLEYINMIPRDVMIIADPEQLKRVVSNIVGNSVKYMDKPEGHILIHLIDYDDSVRIDIEDNGKGISSKDLLNIFERFYRTDASRNSTQGGSGIGLSIAKKIIEDHGGYIWASSLEGEGTQIHFVIRKYVTNKSEHYKEQGENQHE